MTGDRSSPRRARVVVLLLLCAAAVSCDDAAPVCGNGIVENGEDCDQTAFAWIHPTDCRDHGFNGGQLGCTPGCAVDFSGCVALETCGDGVLQPALGELVEVDYHVCSEEDHFGGVMTTTDCQTHQDTYCGDFRLVNEGMSVKAPGLFVDEAGGIWLRGRTAGAFEGFENPGCPGIAPLEDCDDAEGYYGPGFCYPKDCDQSFLGRFDAASDRLQVVMQDAESRFQGLLDMGAQGIVSLRAKSPRSSLERLDRDGNLLETAHLARNPGQYARLIRSSETELALLDVTGQTEGGLAITMITLPGLAQQGPIDLAGLDFASVHYTFEANRVQNALRLHWISSGEFYLLLNLSDGQQTGLHLVKLGLSGLSLEVLEVVPLAPGLGERRVQLARLDPVQDRIKLIHSNPLSTNDPIYFETLTFDGTSIERRELPRADVDGALVPTPEGGWVVTRLESRDTISPTLAPVCEPLDSTENPLHVVSVWFDAAGRRIGEQTFFAPQLALPTWPVDPGVWVCEMNGLGAALDGNTLYITGAYDRARPFCTTDEPLTFFENYPLHACGIYVLRMERPAAE